MEGELTDPAREMGELIRWLKEAPPTPQPAWQVLGLVFDVDPNSAAFLELIAAIRSRIEHLTVFTTALQDSYFGPDDRQRVLNALGTVSVALTPSGLNGDWPNLQAGHFRTDDAVALRMFGSIARLYRPLRKVADEERDQLVADLETLIAEIPASFELANWSQEAMRTGLSRTIFVIRHLRVFGHEVALREIAALRGSAQAVEATAAAPDLRKLAGRACVIAAGAVALFIAPSDTASAIKTYIEWGNQGVRLIEDQRGHTAIPAAEENLGKAGDGHPTD